MLVRISNYSIIFFSRQLYFFDFLLPKSLMLPEAIKSLYVKKNFILILKGLSLYLESSEWQLGYSIIDVLFAQTLVQFTPKQVIS